MAVEKLKQRPGGKQRVPFKFNLSVRRRRKSFRFRFRVRGGVFFKKRKKSLYRRRRKVRIFNFHTPLTRNVFMRLSPIFRFFNKILIGSVSASRISHKTEISLMQNVCLGYPYKVWGSRLGGIVGVEALRQLGLLGRLSSFNQSFRILSLNRKGGLNLTTNPSKNCLFSVLQNAAWLSYSSTFNSFLKLHYSVLPTFSSTLSPLVIQFNDRLLTFQSLVLKIKKAKVAFKSFGNILVNIFSYFFYSFWGWLSWWCGLNKFLFYEINKTTYNCQPFVN